MCHEYGRSEWHCHSPPLHGVFSIQAGCAFGQANINSQDLRFSSSNTSEPSLVAMLQMLPNALMHSSMVPFTNLDKRHACTYGFLYIPNSQILLTWFVHWCSRRRTLPDRQNKTVLPPKNCCPLFTT